MKRYYIFFAVLAVVCVLAIASNVLLRRGPVHDATAANDIREIQSQVDNYYLRENRLPINLNQVDLSYNGVGRRLGDYEYRLTGVLSYEICTRFETEHHPNSKPYTRSPTDVNIPDPDDHAKGAQCFSYTVLPIRSSGPDGL